MEQPDFRKLLFESAVYVKACDGTLDEERIGEIELIVETTPYFKELDSRALLHEIAAELSAERLESVERYLLRLGRFDLTATQELLILEIMMRIIHAADKPDPKEIAFIQNVRSRLKVFNEIIIERFGAVDYLMAQKYDDVKEAESERMIESIKSPDLMKFNDVNLEDAG